MCCIRRNRFRDFFLFLFCRKDSMESPSRPFTKADGWYAIWTVINLQGLSIIKTILQYPPTQNRSAPSPPPTIRPFAPYTLLLLSPYPFQKDPDIPHIFLSNISRTRGELRDDWSVPHNFISITFYAWTDFRLQRALLQEPVTIVKYWEDVYGLYYLYKRERSGLDMVICGLFWLFANNTCLTLFERPIGYISILIICIPLSLPDVRSCRRTSWSRTTYRRTTS